MVMKKWSLLGEKMGMEKEEGVEMVDFLENLGKLYAPERWKMDYFGGGSDDDEYFETYED